MAAPQLRPSQLTELCAAVADTRSQFRGYHQLVIEHLALEEGCILGPWLTLTQTQVDRTMMTMMEHSALPLGGGTTAMVAWAARDEACVAVAMVEPPKSVLSSIGAGRAAVDGDASFGGAAAAKAPPKLYHRHGQLVDMTRGCCFDGVDTCCKMSAYRKLLRQHQQ